MKGEYPLVGGDVLRENIGFPESSTTKTDRGFDAQLMATGPKNRGRGSNRTCHTCVCLPKGLAPQKGFDEFLLWVCFPVFFFVYALKRVP